MRTNKTIFTFYKKRFLIWDFTYFFNKLMMIVPLSLCSRVGIMYVYLATFVKFCYDSAYQPVGLSTGRAGSGLFPTRTRPDFIGWEKSLTRNRPGQSFGFVGSGCIGFGSVSVGFGFAGVERNLTGFWPKYGRISSDLVRSNKIWSIFSYNYKDRAEILMDLAEICLYRRT